MWLAVCFLLLLFLFVCFFVGEMARVEVPKIPARFTGTGDLFTALLLAWRQEGLQVSKLSLLNSCGPRKHGQCSSCPEFS